MKVSTLIRVMLITIIAGTVSCKSVDSDDINQQKIYTSYYLKYDLEKDETLAYATFEFGSSFVRLKDPAYVSFQNDKMIKNDAFGIISYDLTYRGLMNAGNFYYRDANGDEYHNNAVIVQPISFKPDNSTLSASQGGELFWNELPVSAGQTASVTIKTNSGTLSFSTEAIGANSIRINGDQISEESKGAVTLKLCRSKDFDIKESPKEGGTINTEYCSAETDFTISD